jgi:predicted HTH domain antitoxin
MNRSPSGSVNRKEIIMPTRSIKVNVEAPEEISPQAKELAQRKAHEAAVLELWQQGELSASRAAEEMALTIHDFLDLLAAHGLPVESGPLNLTAIEQAKQRLAGGPS